MHIVNTGKSCQLDNVEHRNKATSSGLGCSKCCKCVLLDGGGLCPSQHSAAVNNTPQQEGHHHAQQHNTASTSCWGSPGTPRHLCCLKGTRRQEQVCHNEWPSAHGIRHSGCSSRAPTCMRSLFAGPSGVVISSLSTTMPPGPVSSASTSSADTPAGMPDTCRDQHRHKRASGTKSVQELRDLRELLDKAICGGLSSCCSKNRRCKLRSGVMSMLPGLPDLKSPLPTKSSTTEARNALIGACTAASDA